MIHIVRRFSYSAVVVITFLCALSSSVFAQGRGVVEGYVRDRQGKALSGITVILKASGGMQVDRASTDNEGHYIFSQINAGQYHVSVEPEGMQPEVRQVQMVAEENEPHRREDFVIEGALLPTGGVAVGEPTFAQQVPKEAQDAYQKGVEHMKGKRRDEALAQFEEALAKFPNYFDALRSAGFEYMQRNDIAKAGNACMRAASVNRASASARFCLGWAYYQAEKLDDASRELTESGKLNPRAAEPFWFLGMTEIERKQWAAAEQAFATYRQLHPRDDRPMLHMYLTSVYDALGRPAEAVRSLEAYLKAIPEKERTPKLRDLLAQLKKKVK